MLARAEVLSEGEKGFTLFLPCERHKEEVRRAGRYVWVDVPDPRLISREQQKKAHVLIGCIADWYGATLPEMMKVLLKEIFCYEARDAAFLAEGFSLATCSVEEARLFISWLLDFCLLHDVPAGVPLSELAEDIPRYVYACLLHHRCALCGKRCELHHVDSVGAHGGNRRRMNHLGLRVLPLCRCHHHEIHKTGKETFLKKYFLEPVRVDERIGRAYHLKIS